MNEQVNRFLECAADTLAVADLLLKPVNPADCNMDIDSTEEQARELLTDAHRFYRMTLDCFQKPDPQTTT